VPVRKAPPRPEEAFTYLIFKEGPLYLAKCGTTGRIVFFGTEASTVIQSAINASPGGRILLRAGIYLLGSELLIARSDISLEGESTNAVLRQRDGANLPQLIRISDAYNTVIRNLTVDGNRAANASGNGIVVEGESHRGRIENVQVWNAYTGIVLRGITPSNWIIKNNHVENCYESGIALVNRVATFLAYYALITGNNVVRTGHHGILLSGVSNNIASNNMLREIGVLRTDGFAHAIAVDGDKGTRPNIHNKIIGNTIYDTRMAGIEIADRSDHVEIIGNHVELSKGSAIYFGGGFAPSCNAVIESNICYNSGGDGICLGSPSAVDRSASIVVKGNICASNKGHGIFAGWINNLVITENIAFNNDTTNIDKDGVRIADCTDVVVSSNRLFDDQPIKTQNYGIAIWPDAANVEIRCNHIGPHQFGAIVSGGTGARRISGNFGYVTENSGTATIPAGATSVTVAHGLAGTPRAVKHCPRANLGAVWVSARDSVNITLNVAVAPTVATITDWEAEL